MQDKSPYHRLLHWLLYNMLLGGFIGAFVGGWNCGIRDHGCDPVYIITLGLLLPLYFPLIGVSVVVMLISLCINKGGLT